MKYNVCTFIPINNWMIFIIKKWSLWSTDIHPGPFLFNLLMIDSSKHKTKSEHILFAADVEFFLHLTVIMEFIIEWWLIVVGIVVSLQDVKCLN